MWRRVTIGVVIILTLSACSELPDVKSVEQLATENGFTIDNTVKERPRSPRVAGIGVAVGESCTGWFYSFGNGKPPYLDVYNKDGVRIAADLHNPRLEDVLSATATSSCT